MLDVDAFVRGCKEAAAGDDGVKGVRKLMRDVIATPHDITDRLGVPNKGGIETLYHGEDLTVLNIVWAPQMAVPPHNHLMWAIIGIYQGAEDNIFWRNKDGVLEAAGAEALRAGDVSTLGKDIIHSVNNPTDDYTGALHVYGGDFFGITRSDWDSSTLRERPFDIERTRQNFATANARWECSQE
jgi:predicted metal-dependent enzyme (double-stranded beta helix superfamily)